MDVNGERGHLRPVLHEPGLFLHRPLTVMQSRTPALPGKIPSGKSGCARRSSRSPQMLSCVDTLGQPEEDDSS